MRKNQPTVWNDDCQRAFEKIKECLISPPVLVPPILGRPLLLYLSISDMALGYMLAQLNDSGKDIGLGHREAEALCDRVLHIIGLVIGSIEDDSCTLMVPPISRVWYRYPIDITSGFGDCARPWSQTVGDPRDSNLVIQQTQAYEPIQACQLMEELLGRVKQGFWTFTGLNFKWKHEHKPWEHHFARKEQWRRGKQSEENRAQQLQSSFALSEHFLKSIFYMLYTISKLRKSRIQRFKPCTIWS
ncbi:hypothetical protein CK203_002394 [Vitis vinifera]|uniref:Reverse transcriptase/retrotransposon-derived protein RNase H-like domain-containing protein n=1 Tax=Vitis vinifera TaxID=29760 RepID=A0A438KIA6_VITVI|nr:hypothetical protein CK203_002394 [Vitis vinifera]